MTTPGNAQTLVNIAAATNHCNCSDNGQNLQLENLFAVQNNDAMVEESLNDSKRELSYDDYYGDDHHLELPPKKQKLEDENSTCPSCAHPLAPRDYRKPSLPALEMLNKTMRKDLRLDDTPADEWRRQAHVSTMLQEASKIAKTSIEALFADELHDRRIKPSDLKRRNSFVIHPKRLPAASVPETCFHESYTSMEVDSSEAQVSTKDLNRTVSFLAQPFDVPCWRKPIVSPESESKLESTMTDESVDQAKP